MDIDVSTVNKEELKHMRKTAGLYVLKNKHPLIKRLRKSWPAPAIHGDKIWSSSYLIMNYLNKHPLEKGDRVMEIGCGWGLLGIYCADKFKAKVTGVDADPNVLPYLKVHAALNDVKVKAKESYFEKLSTKTLGKYDAILGGDICFWPKLVDPLYQVVKRGMKGGVGTIIIADPGRSPFLKLAKKCKKEFNAKLIDTTIRKPAKADGYLLVVKNK